jgi:hypothetical protein
MKNLAVGFFCFFIFLPAIAGAQWIFPTGSGEGEAKPTAMNMLQATPADRESQTEPAAVPASPANNSLPKEKHRPHLIELSSANWRPLTTSENFDLFARDMIHWGTHASIAFDSGLSFATKDRPFLGNGARGYFTRYGLSVADETNFTFFTGFLLPSLFREDPRYIPRDAGTVKQRLAYAVTRVLVARSDRGLPKFNFSKIVGTLFATSISSAMYSSYGADIGVQGNFVAYGYNVGTDAAFDIFKEFWPDVARKLKIKLWIRNMVRASLRDYVRVS